MNPLYRGLVFSFLIILLGMSVFSSEPVFTEDQSTEKVLVYAMPYNFTDFNVFTTFSYANLQWMSTIFAGIYERDSDIGHSFAPLLADNNPIVTKIENNDTYAMKVRVTLKEGLKFSDGNPLTAEDVKYTYQLHMTWALHSISYGSFGWIIRGNDSIVVVDDRTIDFYLRFQYAFYQEIISTWVLPKHIYQPAIEQGIYNFSSDPMTYLVGAGPFKLESIDRDNNVITVVKNPFWTTTGKTEPGFDKIIFKQVKTKEAALEEFTNGKVDLLDPSYKISQEDTVSISGLKRAIVSDGMHQEMALNNIHPVWGHTAQLDLFLGKTYLYHDGTQYTIRSFWDEISNHQMSEDERVEAARLVREAISYIVPRQQIVDTILNGSGFPAATIVPPSVIGWNSSLLPRKYSIEKAMQDIIQAFSLAGWHNITSDPNSDGIYVGDLMNYFNDWSITLLSPNTKPDRTKWALLIEKEFPKIGIRVKDHINDGWEFIVPRTFGYYLNSADFTRNDGTHTPVPLYDQGGYDLLFIGYFWKFDWDPQGIYATWAFLPYGINFYNWWDHNYDNLIGNYNQTLDPVIRQQVFDDIQNYLYFWQPSIPIIYPADTWVYRINIQGLDFTLLSATAQQWWKLTYVEISETTTSETTTSNTNTTNTTSSNMTSPWSTTSNENSTSSTTTEKTQPLVVPFSGFASIMTSLTFIALTILIIKRRKL